MVSGGSAPACRRCERLGQEARAEILEGRGRPVIELEHEQPIRASGDGGGRRRKIERRLGNFAEHRQQPVAGEESGERAARDLRQALAGAECAAIDARQPRGHVQSAVRRQPLHDGLAQRDRAVRRPACSRIAAPPSGFTTRAPAAASEEIHASDRSP